MANTPEHVAWKHMKDRCYNPRSQRYDRYGARGIRVCERWRRSFVKFYEDLGPRPSPAHSLERLDNDGNYEPSNVMWALRDRQNNNKSTSRFIEFRGERLTLTQWANRLGIGTKTIEHRINIGWPIELALSLPVSRNQRVILTARNHLLDFNGESLTIAEWSRRTGLSANIIAKRISSGWSSELALTTPPRMYVLRSKK